tara:strand:+ start:1460 stop:1621 length:162 start_codon:yes stop_codon:yes gene_type:complete
MNACPVIITASNCLHLKLMTENAAKYPINIIDALMNEYKFSGTASAEEIKTRR